MLVAFASVRPLSIVLDKSAIGSKYILSNAIVTFVNAPDVTSVAIVDFNPVEMVDPAAKICAVATGLMMLAIADKTKERKSVPALIPVLAAMSPCS
jgi:hypothetical protein